MRLLSWNVNGLRAIAGKGFFEWLTRSGADLVGLQETKAQIEQIPDFLREPLGYRSFWSSSSKKKGYSGVGVYSALTPLAVTMELPGSSMGDEGRLLHLELPKVHFINVYFPNGQMGQDRLDYKLAYYEEFLLFAEHLRQSKPIVVCGDFNTAHQDIDLARPRENEQVSGFLPIERAFLDKFTQYGYIDSFRALHPDAQGAYSWWSYRTRARERNAGWRIDYFFISQELRSALRKAWIEQDVTGSDHCPVGIELECP